MAFWVEGSAHTKVLRWKQPDAPEEAEGQERSETAQMIDRVPIRQDPVGKGFTPRVRGDEMERRGATPPAPWLLCAELI